MELLDIYDEKGNYLGTENRKMMIVPNNSKMFRYRVKNHISST